MKTLLCRGSVERCGLRRVRRVQVLTREDFAARREAAENAKKARCAPANRPA